MFAKLAAACFVAVSVFSTGVVSAPAAPLEGSALVARGGGGTYSFANYNGYSSLSNFDNFYGSSNFDNAQFSEKSISVVKEKEVVCHSESVEIIQQRLLVLQEMAKRIITEQICEVETQTVVFEQFHSSMHGFSRDLRRLSGRDVGYDSSIASHFSSMVDSSSSELSTNDLGFSGHDLGSSYVVPSGDNWSDSNSPSSVGNIYKAARSAVTTF